MNESSGGGLALYPNGKTFGGASPVGFTVDNSVAIVTYLQAGSFGAKPGLAGHTLSVGADLF
ncbi:MAG: hypothetical protein V9G13_13865 [Marmoricola sp.]